MGPLLAARDPSACAAACRAYSVNEQAAAKADRVRGPSRRTQFLRSGGTSYSRRYYRLYAYLRNVCMGSFCANLASK